MVREAMQRVHPHLNSEIGKHPLKLLKWNAVNPPVFARVRFLKDLIGTEEYWGTALGLPARDTGPTHNWPYPLAYLSKVLDSVTLLGS